MTIFVVVERLLMMMYVFDSGLRLSNRLMPDNTGMTAKWYETVHVIGTENILKASYN